MKHRKWLGRALGAALLATSLGACDFISGVDERNPNVVPDATVDQLFVSAQVNTFLFAEGQISRLSSMWLQQMAGTDRQFSILDQYIFDEGEADGEFSQLYTAGGLIDLNVAQEKADSLGCPACEGMLQVLEGYLIGMGASVFGDIPFSEAVVRETGFPKPDPQEQVYAQVQDILDQAIANLRQGAGGTPLARAAFAAMKSADLNYNGNIPNWIALAHTLKARFYMHWVEAQRAMPPAGVPVDQAALAAARTAVRTACGGPDCIRKAFEQTKLGIKDPSANFLAVHSTASTDANLWYQFMRDRSGYIAAGAFLVDLLKTREDPRLPIYFTPATAKGFAGQFVGSPPGNPKGDPGPNASSLNIVGQADYNQPIVLCSENFLIQAEAAFYLGMIDEARESLRQGVRCQERFFALSGPGKAIPIAPNADKPLTGKTLLSEILAQKYIALFLNTEAWNDYKRTCLPPLITYNNLDIPRRLFIGQTERETNPNIPPPDKQLVANRNDPFGCPTKPTG